MLLSLFDIGSIEVMDDHSWMYRDLPQELQMMDYCNEVQGFINYSTSNPRNIIGCSIKCSSKRCKNKNSLDPDVVTMHFLQKEFIKEYMCWSAHGEPFVPHETMIERMVRSTSIASNVHRVVNDNVILIGLWLWI
jgi:hypothetical protein